MEFCEVIVTFTIFAALTPTSTGQTPSTCADVSIIDCQQPGLCNDAEFASVLCPKTCGHCTDLIPDCGKQESTLCSTNSEVCNDIELAVLVCPHSCGLCGTTTATTRQPAVSTTITPPPGSTTTANPAGSTIPSTSLSTTTTVATTEASTVWPYFCPSCIDAIHTRDCLSRVEQCTGAQECRGVVKNWKLTMMCSSPLICEFEQLQSPRNCSSGEPFGPSDECTFCCQGSDCQYHIKQVQIGLDSIPLVLHCPTCSNETDPKVCAERIVPCSPTATTCRVTNSNGLISAGCDIATTCEVEATGLNCQPSNTKCTWCCQGSTCLTNALGGLDLTLAPPTSNSSTSKPPCVDADFYPCDYAKDVACNDENMSLTACPVTCGRCNDL